jgi:hypothetical protein
MSWLATVDFTNSAQKDAVSFGVSENWRKDEPIT